MITYGPFGARATLALLLAVFLLAAVAPTVHADLDDFRRDVEEEEDANRDEREEQAGSEEEGGSNPFARLLYEITIFAWTLHNTSVFYADFPYADRPLPAGIRARGFVHFDPDSIRIDENFTISRVGPQRKRYWFDVHSGALATEDGGYGGMASLQGRFTPFFGPDIDTRFIADGDDLLNITTAGIDVSILQHDFFTWTLYGKWAGFRGILERNGGAMGSQIHTYPFDPVSLHLRTGAMVFPNITFAQVEGRLAVHVNRLALFGGVNLLQSENARLLSFETGATVAW